MKFTPPIPSCSNENFYFHAGDYSFGFNGKELDKEGMGGGASTYDYGFRIYNAALGKFLCVDPLSNKYPFYSTYHYASNSPILNVDIDGLEGASTQPNTTANVNETISVEGMMIIMNEINNDGYEFRIFNPICNPIEFKNSISRIDLPGGQHMDLTIPSNPHLILSSPGLNSTQTEHKTNISIRDVFNDNDNEVVTIFEQVKVVYEEKVILTTKLDKDVYTEVRTVVFTKVYLNVSDEGDLSVFDVEQTKFVTTTTAKVTNCNELTEFKSSSSFTHVKTPEISCYLMGRLGNVLHMELGRIQKTKEFMKMLSKLGSKKEGKVTKDKVE